MGKGSFDHWHSKYFHCQSTEISHAPRQPNCVASRLSVKTHQFHFTALIQICLKRLKFCNDRLFVLSLPICYVLQSVTKTKSLEQLDTWATFKRLSSTSESRISMMLCCTSSASVRMLGTLGTRSTRSSKYHGPV